MNDTGIVAHQHIAGTQKLPDAAKTAIGKLRFAARIDHQQARRIARDNRAQGDTLARQFEVEGRYAHRPARAIG